MAKEIDLVNRDPNGMNNYIQVYINIFIQEPDLEIYSFDIIM